jgi:mRNA-degrading endonuclease RelE of RelBE toxin-antitoxin system
MFNIKIKRKALRTLAKLDEKRKRKIKTVVLILKNDPIPFRRADICKLKAHAIFRNRFHHLKTLEQVLLDLSFCLK